MTRARALEALQTLLTQAGIADGAREARLLLCAAAGIAALDLLVDPEALLAQSACSRLSALAERRAGREPLSRLIGRREFWGLSLAISPDVLDPRPETETIIEAAIAAFSKQKTAPLRLLDLGTGSGALLCALLGEFANATGIAVDLSEEAALIARANLIACGFGARADTLVGQWALALDARFDLIVANPPYIASADLAGLEAEVRNFDPHLALDGGPDGLDAYRALTPEIARLLKTPGGRFFLEVGAGQAERVLAIAAQAGLAGLASHADLAGRARVISGRSAA